MLQINCRFLKSDLIKMENVWKIERFLKSIKNKVRGEVGMRKQLFLMMLCAIFVGFGFVRADMTIDGGGGSLELSPTGTLGVGTGAKLTLKNVTIDSLSGNATTGRLIMHHSTSQLVLQNSTLSLDGNYSFTQGSLVIKGDCTITGTAGTLFTFHGHNILIDDNSTLRVKNVTFQAAPTSRMRQLVRYGNSTSELLLDNATFKCDNSPSALMSSGGMMMVGGNLVIKGSSVIDNTGTSSMHALFLGNGSYSSSDCRLVVRPRSKLTVRNAGIVFKNVGVGSLDLSGGEGALVVDHGANFLIESQVNLGSSTFNFDFLRLAGISRTTFSSLGTSIDEDHGGTVRNVEWSPDGQYLLLSGNAGTGEYDHRVYSFDGSSFSHLIGAANIHGQSLNKVSWHPAGSYLSVVGDESGPSSYTHRVYSFDGNTTTSLFGSAGAHGADSSAIDWSPDGRSIAIGGEQGTGSFTHRVYSFDGTIATTLSGCNKDHGATVRYVNWSPDGKYLAIGGSVSGGVTHRIYSFDGSGLTEVSTGNHGATVMSVSWSSDRKYLAIVGSSGTGTKTQRVYSFDGSSLTEITNENHGAQIRAVNWSSDGKYLAIGGGVSGGTVSHRVYRFDGNSLTEIANGNHVVQVNSVFWYPDDRFLAIGGNSSTNVTHRAYPSVYSSSQALAEFQTGTLYLGGRTFRSNNLILKAS